MTFFPLSVRALAATAAIAALAGAAITVGRPKPIENAVLGTAWECSRTAFVLTSCAPRMQQATPPVESSRKEGVWATRG